MSQVSLYFHSRPTLVQDQSSPEVFWGIVDLKEWGGGALKTDALYYIRSHAIESPGEQLIYHSMPKND